MPRATSRSPSKRRSPNERYIRRHSRRDRSRSPYRYSHIRRKSLSPSERRHRSRSTSPRRRVHKKHRSRSVSRSPIRKSRSPSLGLAERKRVLEKAQQEEERKRRQKEAELKLLEEETARRIEEAIKKKGRGSIEFCRSEIRNTDMFRRWQEEDAPGCCCTT